MKIGLVTYAPEKVAGYDIHVFYSKWVDGQVFPPAKDMQNDVTCFCDAKAIREEPSIVAVSKDGAALRKNRRFNLPFDYVCPTNPQYRAKLLDYLDSLSKEQIEGVTLEPLPFSGTRILCLPPMRRALAERAV